MTEEERDAYVAYRLESARNTFEAARVLAENDFFFFFFNRLYYALFYAVHSLLVNNNIVTK